MGREADEMSPSNPVQRLIAKTNSFSVVLAEVVTLPPKARDSISKRQHKSFQILLFIIFYLSICGRKRGAPCFWGGQRARFGRDAFSTKTDAFSHALLLILMCAARGDFISNNDNHSAVFCFENAHNKKEKKRRTSFLQT